jgi:hypothetical protein
MIEDASKTCRTLRKMKKKRSQRHGCSFTAADMSPGIGALLLVALSGL